MSAEDAVVVHDWLMPVVETVGAKLSVADEVDAFKSAADPLGLEYQVGVAHLKRNTAASTMTVSLASQVDTDEDGSLAVIEVAAQQAMADQECLGELILSRRPSEEKELKEVHQCYATAPATKRRWPIGCE